MIRRVVVGSLAFLLIGWVCAGAASPVLEVFRAQLELEKKLLLVDLANLEREQDQLGGGCDRLTRLGEDLLRGERENEELASFVARSADVRRAEVEVADLIAAAQQLRTTLGSRRGLIEQLQKEVARMEESSPGAPDDLSGRWSVVAEPGGQRGVFDLRLDGTILTGVYSLSGGFRGSLRGTLVSGSVRLERIDAEKGFVAVYTAKLVTQGNERRLEGVWESTNLAAGMPVSGSWVARRDTR